MVDLPAAFADQEGLNSLLPGEACPSSVEQELQDFREAGILQKEQTKFPLRFDMWVVDDSSPPVMRTKWLDADMMTFPILPASYVVLPDQYDLQDVLYSCRLGYAASIVQYNILGGVIQYNFNRNEQKKLKLISILDKSFVKHGIVLPEWLDRLFISPNTCLPYYFYYDYKEKSSSNRLLEKLGYHAVEDGISANYAVDEKIWGMPVSEISIPTTKSDEQEYKYTITINEIPSEIIENIKNKTGVVIGFKPMPSKEDRNFLYLTSVGYKKTQLICNSYTE